MEYPFENSIEATIELPDELDNRFYPYYLGENFIAVLGCDKEEWNVLFNHTIQLGHILQKRKAYFVWDEKRIKVNLSDYQMEINEPNMEKLNEYGVGFCVPLIETPYNTLSSFCYLGTPIQMFVSPANENDQKNKTNSTSRIIPYISATNPSCVPLISDFNGNVFCHATLQINTGNKNNEFYIGNLISYCSAHGFKGVVFHCGRKTNKTTEQTLENMYDNILSGLDKVRMIYSKFLLETPAGQEGEVLSNIYDFIKFVRKLRRVNTNVEVCVDTCHVFACGYDPYFYIKKLQKEQIPIGLVHVNDSKGKFNSRVDRHEKPGEGKIPCSWLEDTVRLCKNSNIPMVYEC